MCYYNRAVIHRAGEAGNIVKTFRFKLYRSKRNRKLVRQIELAGRAYNHCLDLHYRFWGLYHQTISVYALQKHLTKLRHIPRFAWLKDINSQALQDIAQRIDRSYRIFWQHKENGFYGAPPKKQDVKKYTSFTLKQSGWKLDEATHTIRLLGQMDYSQYSRHKNKQIYYC